MTKLIWDDPGTRLYESGVDRGVLYPRDGPGVVWNGLVSINETPSGAESSVQFIDGRKYRVEKTQEGFQATIEAFSYPREFEEYDGISNLYTAQHRESFNFSYRSLIGNDVDNIEHGYKIHLVYNALATPSSKQYATLAADIEPSTMAWDISTSPEFIPGFKPAAHIVISSVSAYPWVLQPLEDILYGTETSQPRFPTTEEILELFENGAILKIIDHGDGTWTAIGPDEVIQMLDPTTFEISWPSAVYLDSETYKISSL